jgi:hypothetical protein
MHEHGDNATGTQGYEPSDIQLRIVLWAGIAVVVMTFLAYVVSTFVVRYVNAQPAISSYDLTPMAVESRSEPFAEGVRLQVDAPLGLSKVRTEQHRTATTFGVVSAEPEIYRVPVDTAMGIVAERGLPEFPKLSTEESEGTN